MAYEALKARMTMKYQTGDAHFKASFREYLLDSRSPCRPFAPLPGRLLASPPLRLVQFDRPSDNVPIQRALAALGGKEGITPRARMGLGFGAPVETKALEG